MVTVSQHKGVSLDPHMTAVVTVSPDSFLKNLHAQSLSYYWQDEDYSFFGGDQEETDLINLFLQNLDWGFEGWDPEDRSLRDGEGRIVYLDAFGEAETRLLNIVAQITHQAGGLVVIENIDQGLPLKKHSNILKALSVAFPNLQFVVSTNSPMVLWALGPGQVVLLEPEPHLFKGDCRLMTATDLYRDVFGIRETPPTK